MVNVRPRRWVVSGGRDTWHCPSMLGVEKGSMVLMSLKKPIVEIKKSVRIGIEGHGCEIFRVMCFMRC